MPLMMVRRHDPSVDGFPARLPLSPAATAEWPHPVGRVELDDGLAYLHAAGTGGFGPDDLDDAPDDGRRYELVDGVVVVSPSPGRVHQGCVARLLRLLMDAAPPGYEPLPAPYDVRVSRGKVLQPDLVVLADDDRPALVVEILSKYGRAYDRGVKLRAYEEAGIPAYWVVDPEVPAVTIWRLDPEGRYQEAGYYADQDACAVTTPYPLHLRPADLRSAPR